MAGWMGAPPDPPIMGGRLGVVLGVWDVPPASWMTGVGAGTARPLALGGLIIDIYVRNPSVKFKGRERAGLPRWPSG